MKKLLFLDIDGVLHPLAPNSLPLLANLDELSARVDLEITHGHEPDFISPPVSGEFQQENMLQLCRIVACTCAELILTSTWRATSYQRRAAVTQLHKHGIIQDHIRCTPLLGTGASCREEEICAFLQKQNLTTGSTETVSYCCVDDADLSQWDETIFSADRFVRCQASKGLNADDASRIIAILNGYETDCS